MSMALVQIEEGLYDSLTDIGCHRQANVCHDAFFRGSVLRMLGTSVPQKIHGLKHSTDRVKEQIRI